MGKRRPATTRSTYIVADKAGGTKMPSGEQTNASTTQGMYAVTMPGDTRQSSRHAVQGSTLMKWDDFEGGSWNPVRTLGPQDIYQAPAPAPAPGAPAPARPAPAPASNDGGGGQQQSSPSSYANTAETQAMSEAETARVTRQKLLDQIEERRKLRLKDPRRFGRFSLMSGSETGVPSLLGG